MKEARTLWRHIIHCVEGLSASPCTPWHQPRLHGQRKLPEADMPKMHRHGGFSLTLGVHQHTCGLKSKNPSAAPSFSVRAVFSEMVFARARHPLAAILPYSKNFHIVRAESSR